MTFAATHTRDLVGTAITVTVGAAAKEQIAAVTVTFDGELLEDLELDMGTESYTRSFAQVGSSFPEQDHTLVVTAIDAGGQPHSATTRWSDT